MSMVLDDVSMTSDDMSMIRGIASTIPDEIENEFNQECQRQIFNACRVMCVFYHCYVRVVCVLCMLCVRAIHMPRAR